MPVISMELTSFVACHECDLLQRRVRLSPSSMAQPRQFNAELCGCLLLGVTFALLYSTLGRVAPDSFSTPADGVAPVTQTSMGLVPDYFSSSLVTMTATRFGDI